MSVDELIEEAKGLGLDGVCLTEHDAFWSHQEIQALRKKHQFLVLPGVELNTDAGHVLAFGLEGYVFGLHRPEFVQQTVAASGGVMIAAHPYRRRFLEEPARDPQVRREMLHQASKDEFFRYCHAIEGLNGRGTALENRFSQDLNRCLNQHATGGSDAHRTGQLGTAATRFENQITGLSDLISEVRAGRFGPVDLNSA